MNTIAFRNFIVATLRSRLAGRPHLQKILANIGWLSADRILRMAIGLVVGSWVARYLGPEQYGRMNYSVAFVSLIASFGSLAADNIVVRNLVRNPERAQVILGSTFALKIFGALAVLVANLIAIFVIQPNDSLAHWIVGITATGFLFQAFDSMDLWFQSNVQSKYTIYAKNAAYLGAAALRIALIQMHAPLIAFVWVALAELVVSAIGLLIAYKITGQSILRWRVNLGEIKIILRDSWPLLFSGLMIMIYMRADQIMIGQMIGNTEVGIYATAVRFAEMWNFIPMAVASSTLPSIVSVAHDEKTMYVRLQKLYNMTALLTYTIAIILTLVAYPLVHILLGSAYVRAIPMLIVLAWSGVFTGLGVARSSFLTAMNWPKVHLLTVFLGCIVNLTLNFLLIPRFGGLGAAIASLAAYWFATHGSCFFYRPLLKSGIMLTRAMIYPKV